ncbi:MAG: cell division protein FtsA, partial [Bacteroidaceae bacterium]|nr:cell division protein FtsA [Bacteroidaceae bacterium]
MAKENTTGSFVAAIALGSSKVTGIVGRKEQDGTIRVLSHVAHVSTDFISKGRVFNVEKATACFKTIREQLEEQV